MTCILDAQVEEQSLDSCTVTTDLVLLVMQGRCASAPFGAKDGRKSVQCCWKRACSGVLESASDCKKLFFVL